MEFKRAWVALSLEPDVSVARIAREHGVNAMGIAQLYFTRTS